ncbi:unnamed protein product [Oikopleura dioica]|uniref:Phospholipase A2-like central domain-containing protein n=1 Tax=Oikopleura dioica TaxID=34765 RepID=E4YMT7_OIKDI|nr:unnamed protein product [Oikopleura dioica]
MKIAAFIATFVSANPNDKLTAENNPWMPSQGSRRYKQFSTMFNSLYTPSQLTRAYGYGCYCLNLGDRPLSGTMTGVYPMDAKDQHCFDFVRCNRCVTFDFGPECTPEQVAYEFVQNGTSITCTNESNTCEQAICECDKDSVLGFANVIDIYDPTLHAFNGFEPITGCDYRIPPPGQPKPELDCCGEYPKRRPYNKNKDSVAKYQCCDGTVTDDNECEQSSFN